jgi:hypothetical protein
MFYSVDIGYDLCGPPITTPRTVLLHHRGDYVIRVVDGNAGEQDAKENVPPAPKAPLETPGDAQRPAAWKAVSTDDKNVAKIALLGPAGETLPGKIFFEFPWSKDFADAISSGKASSDGGEAVAMEGTLDEAVHRAALMILKKGRQGNFCVNIFGHETLPADIPLGAALTMDQAEEMQSDDNHYVDARVMVNNMELVLFKQPEEGEDEEKVLRRRIWKYTWWEGALPEHYGLYRFRKVQRANKEGGDTTCE